MQLSTPSCPGNLTNHSPHTLEKKHRQGEETTESAIVLSGAHPKAAGSYREPPGAAGSCRGRDVWGALQIELYVLDSWLERLLVGPLWGSEILPEPTTWGETSGEHCKSSITCWTHD